MNGKVPNVAGIILAAGESSRMGSTKQMLYFRGKSILQCVIDIANASLLRKIVVVIGHQAELIEPSIASEIVTVVKNRDYKSGQSSSVRAGIISLPEEIDAALFLLGDQPLISTATINKLISAYQASRASIVMPVFKGVRGNPVLFARETFHKLELLRHDSGARALFDEYAAKILKVAVDDPYIHFDIDTEDDYRLLLNLESE